MHKHNSLKVLVKDPEGGLPYKKVAVVLVPLRVFRPVRSTAEALVIPFRASRKKLMIGDYVLCKQNNIQGEQKISS